MKVTAKKPYSYSQKLILSAVFGLLCGLLNALLVLLTGASFTTYFTIGLIIPMLLSQQWGWKYGLVATLIGHTVWSSWLTPSSNILVTISYSLLTILWISWHGISAHLYRTSNKRIWNPYIAEIPFRFLYCNFRIQHNPIRQNIICL